MKKLLVKNIGKTRIECLFYIKNGKNYIKHRSLRGTTLLFDRQIEVTADFGNEVYTSLLKEGYTRFSI